MKRIIAFLLAALFCISLAACSVEKKDTATRDEDPAATADTAAAESAAAETAASDKKTDTGASDGKKYNSIEEYINTPDVKESIDSAKESVGDVLTFEYHAEGNKLIYDYTYNHDFSNSAVDELRETLEKSLEDNADYYSQVADVLKRNVSVEDPQVVINYRRNDGTVIATKTYTAK